MLSFPFLITLYAGFTHAFETDHLLAVSNIVISRKKIIKAVKDGMYWGLGHTSTILIMGILVLLLKYKIDEEYFKYFEAAVGGMLIMLGIYRFVKWLRNKKPVLHAHSHTHAGLHAHVHTHLHTGENKAHNHSHLPAYNVGLVHGLAGSGSLILLVISQAQTVTYGLSYLLIFGFGSVAGMMLAAGFFSLPFSQKALQDRFLQLCLVILSGVLCISYGGWVLYHNLV